MNCTRFTSSPRKNNHVFPDASMPPKCLPGPIRSNPDRTPPNSGIREFRLSAYRRGMETRSETALEFSARAIEMKTEWKSVQLPCFKSHAKACRRVPSRYQSCHISWSEKRIRKWRALFQAGWSRLWFPARPVAPELPSLAPGGRAQKSRQLDSRHLPGWRSTNGFPFTRTTCSFRTTS